MNSRFFVLFVSAAAMLAATASTFPHAQAQGITREVRLHRNGGTLLVEACSDSVIHVVFAPGETFPEPRVPVTTQSCAMAEAKVQDTRGEMTLSTRSLRVEISKQSGRLRFLDASGATILEEPLQGGRSMAVSHVAGEDTFEPEQLFLSTPGEAYYGLGQRQEGFMNWRGIPVRMQQVDAQIAIPVVVSNKGYGLFWNNAARTDFNPTDNEVKIDAKTGKGEFTSGEEGMYGFLAAGGTGREDISLKVDDTSVAHLSAYLVPYAVSGRMRLAAHTRYTLTMTGASDEASVFIKGPSEANLTGFRSQVGGAIDYYFFYGPDPNTVIAEYRTLTGAAPLFPKWAYGFLQCRERYSSQAQLLDAAAGFRARKIPVDGIIQDWQYWGKYGWNAMRFDEEHYPAPKEMIEQLHGENLQFLISVWSKFDHDTPIYNELQAKGLLVPGTDWFDAFNPEARKLYWSHMRDGLFRLGVDGWWLDATEPEFDALKGKKTFLGPGEFVRNAYPFYVTKAVYEGQRGTAPEQRVFILTRAAYAGQQRFAAASWSGDIGASWEVLRLQIPAGLNFTASGIPYWTTDVGGFGRPEDQHESVAYHEVLTRWFEYGAFCPLFRIHGNNSETEIWKYGPQVESTFQQYDRLRYRMLPYTYATAWRVTHDGYTMMRGLPLDYPDDPAVADVADEFLFGPSLLVSPVTQPGAKSRSVYLPKDPGWTDFWTGTREAGGRTIAADAPLDRIPLFVKAGSILPLGPAVQFAAQSSGPIELRVYPGADGAITLYEDDGATYNYEKGMYATTAIRWNDKSGTLSIGPRAGSYKGAPANQVFRIVWVKPGHGVGTDSEANADAEVVFEGKAVTVTEPRGRAGK
jgi:alpha-D-xyloside xylohydrolase